MLTHGPPPPHTHTPAVHVARWMPGNALACAARVFAHSKRPKTHVRTCPGPPHCPHSSTQVPTAPSATTAQLLTHVLVIGSCCVFAPLGSRLTHLVVFLALGILCHLLHVRQCHLLQLPLLCFLLPALHLLLCLHVPDAATAQIPARIKVVCDLAITALATQQGSKTTLAS